MDPFLFKVLLVVLLLIGQGVLWGWVLAKTQGSLRWPSSEEWSKARDYWESRKKA